jgi:hypothetical protein
VPHLPEKSPPIPRHALERVLARAAELQASSGGSEEAPPLTEAQLIEIAGEVGLSRDHVRLALAEERSRIEVAPESGFAHAMLGSAVAQASRVVPGDARTVLAQLDGWMQRTESLQVKRRFEGQLSWEPRVDFLSSVRRTLKIGGRGFHLASATEVHGMVAEGDAKRSHVRIVARLDDARSMRARVAAGFGFVGMIVGLPLFWMAVDSSLWVGAALSLVPALGVPMVAVSFARRQFRAAVRRAQVALEQALDGLEYGDKAHRGP